MNGLLEAIAAGWGWKIGRPVEIIAQNAFGNVIVRTEHNLYFRIIPEDLECVLLGTSISELEVERNKPEFKIDWEMRTLVEQAETVLGPLVEGECYHLVIPGSLGGKYDLTNIKKISVRELLNFTGHVAQKIEGLPDGTKIEIEWI